MIIRGRTDWLADDGELAGRIRAIDWSRTSLGPRDKWPAPLRTVLNIVLESKSPMSVLWGPELVALYNDACVEIFADKHPSALGRRAKDIWPETWSVRGPVILDVLEKGAAISHEGVELEIVRHGRAEQAWFDFTDTPVRLEDGSIGGVLVTFQETTAARERTRKLAESEARFRAVIENSRDGINQLDLETGKYILMSPSQVRLTGFTAEELEGLSAEEALERVHPDDRAISLAQQRRIAAGEDPGGEPVEYRWRVKSGEYRWFSDTRTLVRNERGTPVSLVGISRDITERKAAEDARRIYERTRELDSLKARFFANISHELRTPLALILGPTERLLRAGETSEGARRDLTVIERNARLLLRLVGDLLDLSKLDAGKLTARWTRCDLARLTRVVAASFDVPAAEGRVSFEVNAPETLPAELDPEKVQRVLLNLLSNAFKHAPAGGRVRLSLRETAERLVLEVADSGPGVPEERREAVFERFADFDSPSLHGGTGLGLSIARELVALHGGTITAGDAPEGGALFTVELPRRAPQGVTVSTEERALPSAPITSIPGAPARQVIGTGPLVLVVDDNAEMNRFLVESLCDRYRVAAALDAETALEMAASLTPDLILTDLMLPRMSGEHLIAAIRARPALAETPIVVLSAKADEEARVRSLVEGADDYLAKPFSVEELRARVANLVGRRVAEAATRRAEARYRGIITVSADAILSIDESRRITEWNLAAERMFGYPAAEAIGMPLDALLPERHRLTHRDHVALFAQEPETARRMDHGSAVGLRRNGEEFPISASISRLKIGGEQIMTVAVRDISEQKRIEDEQRVLAEVGGALATAEYEGAMEDVVNILVSYVADHAVLFSDGDGGTPPLASASKGAGLPPIASTADLAALRASDPGRTIETPLDAAGRQVGVLGLRSVSRPFTDRDHAVAREVGRRCALFLENVRLHRAEKRAIKARDEILGVVAHDLRNPLNAIVLHAQALRPRTGLPERRSTAPTDGIKRAAARMSRLIEDLVDVVRLDEGKLKLDRAQVAPSILLAEAVEAHLVQAASRGLEITAACPDDLPEVWADKARVHQVLGNLIGNALKLTSRGGVRIGARARGREVELWVTDTGPGIEPGDVPRLFERFWQSPANARGGVGLGLAIVKGIVEAHGGRVWAESKRGSGSTFRFTLPLVAPESLPKAS